MEKERPETFKLSECERAHFGRAPVHFKRTDSTQRSCNGNDFCRALSSASFTRTLARNATVQLVLTQQFTG